MESGMNTKRRLYLQKTHNCIVFQPGKMNLLSYKTRALLNTLILVSGSALSAQPKHPIAWDKNPIMQAIPDSLKKYPAVFILEDRETEMQPGDENMELFYTVHYIIRLNDDKGAEYFNTFNIPISSSSKMIEIKARTLLPGNKVVEVEREKIKKVKSENGHSEYRVAMEGIEPGAEVELFYTIRHAPVAEGDDVYSFRVPVMKAIFRLIVPDNMLYDVKGYNGFGPIRDSVMGDQRSYMATMSNLPAMEDEPHSYYKPSLKRVDYKLSYITRAGVDTVRKMTWQEMSETLHHRYESFTSTELKQAKNLLEQIGVENEWTEERKIVAIEDFFKTKIAISNRLPEDEVSDFDAILKKKISTERGYVHFFAACFRAADIQYHIGMTGNRYEAQMDEKLEMWSHLDEYCFYLTRLNAYLTPASFDFRFPFIPYKFCGSKSVFVTKTSSGSLEKVKPDIRVIPFPGMAQSGMATDTKVHFDSKGLEPEVTTVLSFSGYSASSLRESLQNLPKDKEPKFIEDLLALSDKPSDMKSYQLEHRELHAYSEALPLKVSTVISAPKLLEKAGPNYLFKVGQLIGKQEELYDEEKRNLPVELEYPHQAPHTMQISIPDGYKVVNPGIVRKNESCLLDGKEVCGFHSDYKLEGNTLTITIHEFYERTSIPVSAYPDFRKVINAAADFNKLTLVLQKI